MTEITKNCGRYRVTLVRERGDIKVGYELINNDGRPELQEDATFESTFHLSRDLSHLTDRTAIYPRRLTEWNDEVDPSYTVRDVPILTLVIERKERMEGYLLMVSPREENADLVYRKLLDMLNDDALVGDIIDGDGLLVEEIAKVA